MTAGGEPAGPAVGDILADFTFASLKAMVIDATGMAFYADKSEDLARIFQLRMGLVGAADCAAYLELLKAPKSEDCEMDALVAELTIGETYFFRHKEQFDALRDVILPDVIERNRPFRRLRIWSAGCATGPEPYSIAIMLEREFGHRIADWHVTVLGTDINQKFLARAREGRYDSWAFRTMPDDIRAACFTPVGGQWQINPGFKRFVKFQYHNLIKSRFPSIIDNIAGFDVIICRNVIIYFSPETIESLIPCFHETLTDGGWLIMGHAEPNQHLFRRFKTVNTPGAVLYQRSDRHYQASAPPLAPTPPPPPSPSPSLVLPRLTALDVAREPPRRPETAAGRPSPKAATPRPAPSPSLPVPPPSPPTGGGEGVSRIRELADCGQWEAAAAACDTLLNATPLDAWAHFYRAMIHEQVGEAELCERSLRRAIYLDRKLVLPHYHLGLFLLRRDDAAAAAKAFRNVQALLRDRPDDARVADTDKITTGQMREAVEMHLKLIGEP
ncbi:protein-glutamate O-methyltransferase CheR [Magnetospirillum sp. SS-4]|uniref:CheR family methyltransferase n=1 Tax=Magnetospirillum sp. SS-4 TaxID=2681465 RepID=UPI0013823107|nr:protein-glutamate O-methyltransferase CheR [Magnetospirillum sp. SS-4]CAA7624918.1 Methylase of chemotaxis methyl-accepting protein [Magnetospirillum sp. SS-4]